MVYILYIGSHGRNGNNKEDKETRGQAPYMFSLLVNIGYPVTLSNGGDIMKLPGDNRTTEELLKDINTTLARCGIDKRLIIIKR